MVTRIGSSFPLRQIMTTRLSLGCRAALEGREEFRVISACAGAAAVAGRNYVGSVVDLRQNVRFLTLDTAVAEACFVVEGSKKTYHFHSFVGVVMWEQENQRRFRDYKQHARTTSSDKLQLATAHAH